MRILVVSEDIPNPHLGGLGKHALNLANELATRGHEVDVLGNASHDIAGLPDQRGPGRFFSELAGYERGWKQQHLGLYHAFALTANAKPLREAILRHAPRYDIIHYHGHLPWIAARLPSDLPFVQTRHDQGGDCMLKTRFINGGGARAGVCARRAPDDCASCATGAPNLVQRAVSGHAVRRMRSETLTGYRLHQTIFVSDFLKRNFEKSVAATVPGRVIPNSVDTGQLLESVNALRHEQDQDVGNRQLRIFSAGAMFEYKGFGPLLHALNAVSERHGQRFELKIAGAGPQLPALQKAYAAPHIEFLGWCAYQDVLRHTLAADAVLVPSLCEEPCATSVLEALALGKQVCALRAGGTPEMLAYAHSAGGQLHLFDDLDSLAESVITQKYIRNGSVAGAPQPQRFFNSLAHMTDQIERVYIDVQARCGTDVQHLSP